MLNYGYFPEVPRVQHISTVCPGTAAFRVVWWDTVIEDFDITLGSLCPRDIYVYLFLLGSRFISNVTVNFDLRTLHLLNFRFLRDTAAWYNLYLCSIQNTTYISVNWSRYFLHCARCYSCTLSYWTGHTHVYICLFLLSFSNR